MPYVHPCPTCTLAFPPKNTAHPTRPSILFALTPTQIFGPESSGKTTVAMHAIAEIQKLGETACLVDAEHAYDPSFAAVSPGQPCPSRGAAASSW